MAEAERDGVRVLVPAAWRPPTHRILPELIEEGRKAIARLLEPAGMKLAAQALYPLLVTQILPNVEGMSDENVENFANTKIPEYARLLEKYPADLLRAACDAHAESGSKYFPAVYELTSHAKPALEKRQRQADRLAILLDLANKPAESWRPSKAPKQEEFKPPPAEERLRADVERWRNNPDGFLSDMRKRMAVRAEKRLAEIEGREVEEWARDVDLAHTELQPSAEAPVGGPSKMAPAGAVTRAVMRETTRAMEQAAVEPWEAGKPVYQQPSDEPPPPIDIPEAPELEP